MFFDIIVVIVLALFVYVGYVRGAAKTLVSLLGLVLAFSVSAFLGDMLATLIYDNYIGAAVIDNVSQYTNSAQTVTVAPTVESLPSFVRAIVDFTGFESDASLIDAVNNAKDIVAKSVEAAIRPLVESVLSFVISALLFFIVHFIIRLLILKPLVAVFKLPLIRFLDSALGVAFAFLCAILLISFVAFLYEMILPYINGVPDFLNEQTIYNSYIFVHFYNGNIFNAITSLI